jgi:membrane associated rhomboid family serine protease
MLGLLFHWTASSRVPQAEMFRQLTPVVRALLYANFIAFGLTWPLLGTQSLLGDRPFELFALWPLGSARAGLPPFEPWQLITYAFLHSGWLHILSNMFAVYMFGPDCESLLGSRRFSIYYLTCVVGAAVCQLLVTQYLYPALGPTVGASGGIFGILLLYGMAFPHRQLLLLFPPIPMPAWLFVTLYGLYELWLGVSRTQQGVAHFAHLGGMASGYLLILYWRARAGSRGRRRYDY